MVGGYGEYGGAVPWRETHEHWHKGSRRISSHRLPLWAVRARNAGKVGAAVTAWGWARRNWL